MKASSEILMNKIVSNDVKTNTILKVNVIEKKKIKHESQPNNIFRKKEKPNKKQNKLAWKSTCFVTNQLIGWKMLFQVIIMLSYHNMNINSFSKLKS